MASSQKRVVVSNAFADSPPARLMLSEAVDLARALRSPEESVADQDEGTSSELFHTLDWDVVTKYYSAKLELRAVKSSNTGSSSSILGSAERLREHAVLDGAEAVVLLVNSSETDPLARVTSDWLPLIEEFNPSIRLLVDCFAATASLDESPAATGLLRWCVSNDFEYVQLQPHQSDIEEGETHGLARVREALQSHVWSSDAPPTSADASPTKPEPELHKCSSVACGNMETQPSLFKLCSRCKTARYCSRECQKEDWTSGHKAQCVEKGGSTTAAEDELTRVKKAFEKIGRGKPEGEWTEADHEEADRSLSEAMETLREMKSNTKNMSDEERRKRAAEIALAFYKAMGGDDEGDDDDEEEEGKEGGEDKSAVAGTHA
eukprot:m.76503 g.76503  ORF g.76503 m.76503 type:complete len:377 (+) comp14641_c3_seq5:151-1281(+)